MPHKSKDKMPYKESPGHKMKKPMKKKKRSPFKNGNGKGY